MNSLTANLHLLMVPFYRPTAARHKILIERRAFPSDTVGASLIRIFYLSLLPQVCNGVAAAVPRVWFEVADRARTSTKYATDVEIKGKEPDVTSSRQTNTHSVSKIFCIPSRKKATRLRLWCSLACSNTFSLLQRSPSLIFVLRYYTGQFFDIRTITESAHKKGCMVGWDLAHAVGNVPLQLHDWNVDFAAWCSYKYAKENTERHRSTLRLV